MKLRANVLPLVATVGLAIYAVAPGVRVTPRPVQHRSIEQQIEGKGVDISLTTDVERSEHGAAEVLIAQLQGVGVDIS